LPPPDFKNHFRLTATVETCIFSIMKLTLRATKQVASDIFSFIFVPERPLQWKAGQYLHYFLNHPNPDDRGVERYFSIASAPHEKHVMLTTRFAPKGSSFKKALKKLKPGDAIDAREVGGDFVFDHRRKAFVFIAGGIGITPFRAILLDLDRNGKPLNGQLLYANRINDFPYRQELEALKKRHPEFRIDYVVSPNRIDEKTIAKFVPDMDTPVFYVSGPEPMVESMDKTLKKLGVSRKRVKNDFFPGYHWP
jgi:ferredoxin-NADP reductase